MTTLWRNLWRETNAADVAPEVRRAARFELVLCLLHRNWIQHIVWDYYLVAGDLVRWRPGRRRT